MVKAFRVSLTLFFKKSFDGENKIKEPPPSQEEIDNFMTGYNKFGYKRYEEYVKSLYEYSEYNDTPKDIVYKKGKIEYTIYEKPENKAFNECSYDTPEIIRDLILEDSFEDGLFETEDVATFPVRRTAFLDYPKELGVLDCRRDYYIHVKEIKN
jgi:hypothetical protein